MSENLPTIIEIEPVSVEAVKKQIKAIQDIMKAVMHKDVHYGVIPGCGDKPALLKAGAEKLCTTFRLVPEFEERPKELPNGHLNFEVKCRLRYNGHLAGEGIGSCSTMESKYRWRNASRSCPHCKNLTIIKGKEEYGGGWLCFAKKGGCGAKFPDGDPVIEDQQTGQIENPDIADAHNTVKKMAYKRAHVDATIRALAASDIFTQDIEDLGEGADPQPRPKKGAGKLPSDTPRVNGGVYDGKLITEVPAKYLQKILEEKRNGWETAERELIRRESEEMAKSGGQYS